MGTVSRLTTALADRYRIERQLGQGGMATVCLAHDVRYEGDGPRGPRPPNEPR